mmetsp:Transcript_15819/g.32795  ORF Transcript_15819/g.32795 Transcript_15819/m.32795 type:complete len:110 (-) Transcript_15819:127-456(-)
MSNRHRLVLTAIVLSSSTSTSLTRVFTLKSPPLYSPSKAARCIYAGVFVWKVFCLPTSTKVVFFGQFISYELYSTMQSYKLAAATSSLVANDYNHPGTGLIFFFTTDKN